ncbi:hypothetical Protein YC6258_02080 [Gynuella sunshinyii YC6258]|uniref:Uncharacterized protein n=2 Tax=Gynuella sunshinyii TaxID=1445505 RepID=A0A0C5VHH2_9GAMM|nr:hypothetical Protein YC6258_02080 [Gynuella sunshinyii YC6258]
MGFSLDKYFLKTNFSDLDIKNTMKDDYLCLYGNDRAVKLFFSDYPSSENTNLVRIYSVEEVNVHSTPGSISLCEEYADSSSVEPVVKYYENGFYQNIEEYLSDNHFENVIGKKSKNTNDVRVYKKLLNALEPPSCHNVIDDIGETYSFFGKETKNIVISLNYRNGILISLRKKIEYKTDMKRLFRELDCKDEMLE